MRLVSARDVARETGATPRVARRVLRHELGAGTMQLGAERWPQHEVDALFERGVLTRRGNCKPPPDDDESGWY